MTQTRIFPFRRVSVDHMVRGTTRVWWQLEREFNEPGPYIFQLQFGRTGLRDADDWENVGQPVTNNYFATDAAWRDTGYNLQSHFRVVLKTLVNTYVSQAANCFGELTERDWVLTREIIRKEKLRQRMVSTAGYLIKQMRYGPRCTRCLDPLTQEMTDADCPICSGTGFEVGFHPPLPMQCWDLTPQVITENNDADMKGMTRDNPYVTARVIGFPALNKGDIWVNGSSDERWLVQSIQIVAAIRNVPIVYQVQLGLLPFSNAAYALEVGGEVPERDGPTLPIAEGCGQIIVDQDYLGPDSLIYHPLDGCPLVGADIYVFTEAVYEQYGTSVNRSLAVNKTTTRANGRWTRSIPLDTGDYVLLYEKIGEYGPDIFELTVTPEDAETMVMAAPMAAIPEERRPVAVAPPSQKTPENIRKATNNFWDI